MPERITLTQISSRAWEHPADRAALNTLRSLPGFDEVVKKIIGYFGERGIRQLFLANAVRVGGAQRPKLDALYTEVLETLDAPMRYDLYVSQTPVVNAGAYGMERPFIIVNSGMINLLDDDELQFVLGEGPCIDAFASRRPVQFRAAAQPSSTTSTSGRAAS